MSADKFIEAYNGTPPQNTVLLYKTALFSVLEIYSGHVIMLFLKSLSR